MLLALNMIQKLLLRRKLNIASGADVCIVDFQQAVLRQRRPNRLSFPLLLLLLGTMAGLVKGKSAA